MNEKYELTDESIEYRRHKLYRIKALRDFFNVKKGDLGGFIEGELNLSHDRDCWLYGNAKAFENARVYGNARVCGNAVVCGDARVFGNARIYGKSRISGNCILKFNDWTYLDDLTLDRGIWIDSCIADNNEYIISNTLEQLYVGNVE
jgi:hypothetical protein